MEKISVAVRIRPHSSSSPDSSKSNYWKVVDNTISLCSPLGTPVSGQNFVFDHVFGTESSTASIYDQHTKGVISSALRGFNGTVFAYGQTSSGKTFTMRGSKDSLGLIGLSVHEVFKHIEKIVDREFLVRVSYMEIYNEDINDLLAPESRKLHVHENLEKGIFVAGLREEIVSSPKQVFELLEFGEAHRHVGQTNMNVYSSRSHTIFRMVIESKDKRAEVPDATPVDAVRVSVLNLVDLAGSERVAKTGAGGVRLKEGTHINKSLMTLGNVIKKLSDGAARQGGHIPYRDSKLTRILQPALGGNAKTAIICTIAPEEVHIDETRGTLQFASRAKRVTTCAQVNEILTDAALLKRQLQEIEALRKKLKGLQSEVSEQEILRLRNDLLKYELEKEKLELELQVERKSQLEREQRIREQELKIENLSSLVNTSTFDDTLNKENGKHLENKTIHNDLITVRREKLRSPVNFDHVVEGSAERSVMSLKKGSEFSEILNFENVADEDLWVTMNDGQSLVEPDFLFSTPSRWGSSVGSTKGTSSSVINVLMSSKVKMERYRTQLEEARKEAAELRVQLRDHLAFHAELKHELLNLENEFAESQTVTEGMWESMKQTKSLLSSVICDFVVFEKPQLKLDLVNGINKKSSEIVRLTSKVRELEEELLKFKDENEKLRSQCQAQQSKGNIEQVSAADENTQIKAEDGAPFLKSNCTVNISPWRRLSNAPHLLTPKNEAIIDSQHRMALKVSEVDISARNLQKDYSVCISNDNKCERRGSIYGNNSENVLIQDELTNKEDTVENKADLASMKEMLSMCKEHIRVLEGQLLLANLEKDRATAILKEQVDAHEKTMMAMKLEKRKFAEDIKSVMESIAIQDNFCASICHGIEFDKGMDTRCQNLMPQLPPLT